MESARSEESERRLKKELIAGGPVTCVSFLSDTFCWVARGSFLELAPLVYEGSRKRRTHLVFPNGGRIHGVQHVRNMSVIFGGRQLVVLHGGRSVDDPIHSAKIVNASRQIPPALNALLVSDWIWDLKVIVPVCDNNDKCSGEADTRNVCVAVGMANNACEVWMLRRLHQLSYKAVRQRRIIGTTRAITYSMCFFGWKQCQAGSYSDLIIASGTVSNEILVWTAVTAKETTSLLSSDKALSQPYSCVPQNEEHRLRGHLGVIHAVKFDAAGDRLASASDDRSIRLWHRTNGEWMLLWSGWSHKARVWSLAFSQQGIVSCGEDAAAKVWCEEDGSLLGEVRIHNCQSLWSIDIRDNLVLIGCNDGTAKLWDLRNKIIYRTDGDAVGERANCFSTLATYLVPDDRPISDPCENHLSNSSGTTEEPFNKKKDSSFETTKSGHREKRAKVKVKSQTICGMEFYREQGNRRKLLVSTRAGSLFSLCLQSWNWEKFQSWCVQDMDINANDGSCLAVHAEGSFVVVGTTKGDIIVVALTPQAGSMSHFKSSIAKRRILSARSYLSIKHLCWLDEGTLLSFHIKGMVVVWKFPDLSDDIFCDEHYINEPQFVLNTTMMAVPTCFAYGALDNTLYVGDSRGNIAAFFLCLASDEFEICPTSIAYRVHKKEYVNDILCLPSGRLISVGNDGCIRQSVINSAGELEPVLCISLSALPGPSHIYLAKHRGGGENGIVVAGYHGNSFLALDLSSGYEMFRVETGGRQRAHCCFVDLRPSLFVASYGMAVCVNRADGLNDIVVQSFLTEARDPKRKLSMLNAEYSIGAPLHGEPVFDLCLFTSRPQADYNVLLSGSEDCTSRISIIWHSVIVASELLPTQSSCIRAVCSSRHSGDNTTLLVVCGGQMSVHFYSLVDDNANNFEGSTAASILDKMTVRFLGRGYYPFKPSIDPRINTVRAFPIKDCDKLSHIVVTGDSDGGIHLFKLSEKGNTQRTIAGQLLFMLERPAVAVDIVALHESSRLCIIAGTTDGNIVIWLLPFTAEFSSPLSPLGMYEAHQMGTNSISACVVDILENRIRLRICSGGDDQSITICTADLAFQKEIQNSSPDDFSIVSFARVDVASASAIKGVKLIDANHVLSVGYSQKLAHWQLTPAATTLKLLSTVAVDVSDVNCFSVSRNSNALLAVGGTGIEVFSMC